MKRLQAFKFELKLSAGEKRNLFRFAGSCRFVYNKALALQKERYEKGDKKLTYAGLCKELTVWRNELKLSWLRSSPSQALQQSLKDLERAYQNFFHKRTDFPRFKKRGARDSLPFFQPLIVLNHIKKNVLHYSVTSVKRKSLVRIGRGLFLK